MTTRRALISLAYLAWVLLSPSASWTAAGEMAQQMSRARSQAPSTCPTLASIGGVEQPPEQPRGMAGAALGIARGPRWFVSRELAPRPTACHGASSTLRYQRVLWQI
jgi:hypothetical protein